MTGWKALAASVALLMGISGAAMAQDFDHRDRDWRNNGVYGYRVHDRDDYAYNNGYRNGYYRYNNSYYGRNNYYGRDGDHDRDDRGRRDRDHDRNHDRNWHERGDRDRR